MKSLLLFMDLGEWFSNTYAVTGVVLAALGLALAILARRITKSIRKTDKVADSDTLFLALKGVGLVFIIVALIIITLASRI